MNVRRWMPVAASLAFALAVGGATAWSAGTREPASGFVEGGHGPAPLIGDARTEGYETLRLLSGPSAMTRDPLNEPAKTLLVLVGAARPYTAEEVGAVQSFLADGGRLLVADNFGQANSLTSAIGITFERVRLVEPSATSVPAAVGRTMFDLWAPAPTAVRLDPKVSHSVLANSSAGSFLDRDGDGIISAGDPPGPFVVVASVDVGERGGRVVAIGDTGPFLQTGAERQDNRAFRLALLASLLPDGGRVVLDESREPSPDPWLAAATTVVGATGSPPWQYLAAGLALLILLLGVLFATRGSWGPHRSSVDYFVRRSDIAQRALRNDAYGAGADADEAPTVQWTLRGRAATFGGLALAVFGLMVGSLQATYAASFLLVAAALALTAPPVRMRAQRRVSADQTDEEGEVRVELSLSAPRGRQSYVEVLDELPQEFALTQGHTWFQIRVASKATADVQYSVKAALRGRYRVGPLRMRSMDAFRLRAFETRAGREQGMLVRPRNDPLSGIPFKSKIPLATLGPHPVNRSGEGTEFHALRQYQAGDSIRIVNWKASARSKELVVNQRVHESMATIAVFLDGRALSGAGVARASPLNEGCRAAMSIASGAIKARDKVRLFVYGEGVRELTDPSEPLETHELSNALAELEPRGSTTFGEALHKVLPTLRPRSPFILISGFEGDPTVVDGMLELRQRGMRPVAVVMALGTKPLSTAEGPPEPDAERLQADRDRVISELHEDGVPVVPAVPGTPLPLLLRLGVK